MPHRPRTGLLPLALACLVLLPGTALGFEVDAMGIVDRVVDGDTLDVASVGRIRLADVDAPEPGEPGATEAAEALRSLVLDREVLLDIDDVYETDVYGRLVAVVYVRNNATHFLNVNQALLDEGVAVLDDFPNEFDPSTWTRYERYEASRTGRGLDVRVLLLAVAVAVATVVVAATMLWRRRRTPAPREGRARHLEEPRLLGGIGSLLVLAEALPIPLLSSVLTIAGVLLVVVAVGLLAHKLGDRWIFINYALSVGLVLFGTVLAGMLFGAALAQIPFLERLFQPFLRFPEFTPDLAINVLLAVVLAFVVLWVFYLLSAVFLTRSFDALSSGLGVEMFGTAALVYLIGALLVGVLVGFLVILIAYVLQAVAFFSLPGGAPGPD